MNPRLTKNKEDMIIAGVCSGLAVYLGVDPTLVRLAFLLLIPASGIGLLLYLVLWILMPGPNGEQETLKAAAVASQPHPQRYAIIGAFFVLVGLYLLLQTTQFAWLFWPLLCIGLGIYLLRRRSTE